MIDPSYPLQKAVYDTLIDSGVVAGKVYHTVPDGTALPYCYIGDDIIQAEYEAGRWSRCTVIVDVFAATKPQCKLIAGQVREALDIDLEIEGFVVAEAYYMGTQYVREPNGLTSHAVIELEYLLIPLYE